VEKAVSRPGEPQHIAATDQPGRLFLQRVDLSPQLFDLLGERRRCGRRCCGRHDATKDARAFIVESSEVPMVSTAMGTALDVTRPGALRVDESPSTRWHASCDLPSAERF